MMLLEVGTKRTISLGDGWTPFIYQHCLTLVTFHTSQKLKTLSVVIPKNRKAVKCEH